MKMKRLAALLLLCPLILTACAPREASVLPAATLPPIAEDIVAPVGDAALSHTQTVALYLPSRDGQRLVCEYETLTLNRGRHPAEAVARALMEHSGSDAAAPLGRSVTLRLSASDPIELSGGVCTVNLTPSALQLDHADLYAVCLCLTATLCELKDIRSVNVLVAGQAVGLDVADRLPLGSLAPHIGAELPILWSQMAARRAPVGSDPADAPLTAATTLYYPLQDHSGLIPEVRTLSFTGQLPTQLITELLSAPPVLTDLDTGGRMATLRFQPALEEALQAAGIDLFGFAAAVTCTLTTFVPSLASVQLTIGEQPLTSIQSQAMGNQLFPGGVTRRADFASAIRAQATIYLPRGDRLTAVTRRLPDDDAYHPRTLLGALLAGPTADEQAAGLSPLLPGGLSDADILGIAVDGDTLLVNFSARAAERIRESDLDQHLMCRGLVSALCELMGTPRMRIFFGGDAIEALNGPIFWGGEFLYSPGLTAPTGGE